MEWLESPIHFIKSKTGYFHMYDDCNWLNTAHVKRVFFHASYGNEEDKKGELPTGHYYVLVVDEPDTYYQMNCNDIRGVINIKN